MEYKELVFRLGLLLDDDTVEAGMKRLIDAILQAEREHMRNEGELLENLKIATESMIETHGKAEAEITAHGLVYGLHTMADDEEYKQCMRYLKERFKR